MRRKQATRERKQCWATHRGLLLPLFCHQLKAESRWRFCTASRPKVLLHCRARLLRELLIIRLILLEGGGSIYATVHPPVAICHAQEPAITSIHPRWRSPRQ